MTRLILGFTAVLLTACKSSDLSDGLKGAGASVVDGAQGVAGAATSLVNVNLSNVLNDLAVRLKVEKANIPVNAQIPITLAANICGVSINILWVSTGGQANCTATTSSPDLAQVVQQQMAAGGSVGGGAQTTQPSSTSGTGGTSGTTTAGSTTQPEQDQTQPPQ